MKKLLKPFLKSAEKYFSKVESVSMLASRLVIGMAFAPTGLGKLKHLTKTTEFFASLGIPFPQVQAPMVATLELVGGVCVLIGLATRFVSIPLIGIMVVAIVTAKLGDLENLLGVLDLSEFLYIVLLTWLIARGPGTFSVDHFLKKNFDKGRKG